ncbi:MAG TPA: YceI family protein [Gemmatimonadaceae bacterium]|nr:YceI family protein [Gemmatimonadaceae bacterium]
MRWHTLNVLPALLFLTPASISIAPGDADLAVQPESRIRVSGTSTVKSFECAATDFTVNIASASDAVAATLAGTQAVTTVELLVPGSKLDCSNGTMNEHMLKALKAKEHPTIAFHLASYALAKAADSVQVTMDGTLAMGGVERPITLLAHATAGPDGTLRLVGSHELRMKEWGLKPPSLMLGTMKVNEKVTVAFDLLLKD